MTSAAADAHAIVQIESIGAEETTKYLITSRYIESLRDMARTTNSKVIFMPVETSSMLSSIGAFKEVFAETGEKRKNAKSAAYAA